MVLRTHAHDIVIAAAIITTTVIITTTTTTITVITTTTITITSQSSIPSTNNIINNFLLTSTFFGSFERISVGTTKSQFAFMLCFRWTMYCTLKRWLHAIFSLDQESRGYRSVHDGESTIGGCIFFQIFTLEL